MGDIGYVDTYSVICHLVISFVFGRFNYFEREGVVEVFCISRIDGKSEHIPHVTPSQNLFLVNHSLLI